MSTYAFFLHSCSCCSHETIAYPESIVTWHFTEDCEVSGPSIDINQGFVVNTWVDYKNEW